MKQTPDEHFAAVAEIIHRHAQALEKEIRALQKQDGTADWPTESKQTYNYHFTEIFTQPRIFRNWAADAAGWHLLPPRNYPNRSNRKPK